MILVSARMMSSIKGATEQFLKQYDLTVTEFDVMEVLYTKGEIPLKELSEKMLMANGSITYIVNKLEKRELLKRTHCVRDRRIYMTSLTDKGYQYFDELFKPFVAYNNSLFNSLSEEEMEQYIEMSKRVGKSISDESLK